MARPSKARAALDEWEVSEPSPVAARTVRRALAARESAYLDEVQRLLDAGAGSPDPERDAAAISLVAFGRLEQFLWQSPPSDDDVEHLIEFCLAAIRR